jgi:hypothetical protein
MSLVNKPRFVKDDWLISVSPVEWAERERCPSSTITARSPNTPRLPGPPRIAPHPLDRVTPLMDGDLAVGGGDGVYAQALGGPDEVATRRRG